MSAIPGPIGRFLDTNPVIAGSIVALAGWIIGHFVTDNGLAQILIGLVGQIVGTVGARAIAWAPASVRQAKAEAYTQGRIATSIVGASTIDASSTVVTKAEPGTPPA